VGRENTTEMISRAKETAQKRNLKKHGLNLPKGTPFKPELKKGSPLRKATHRSRGTYVWDHAEDCSQVSEEWGERAGGHSNQRRKNVMQVPKNAVNYKIRSRRGSLHYNRIIWRGPLTSKCAEDGSQFKSARQQDNTVTNCHGWGKGSGKCCVGEAEEKKSDTCESGLGR